MITYEQWLKDMGLTDSPAARAEYESLYPSAGPKERPLPMPTDIPILELYDRKGNMVPYYKVQLGGIYYNKDGTQVKVGYTATGGISIEPTGKEPTAAEPVSTGRLLPVNDPTTGQPLPGIGFDPDVGDYVRLPTPPTPGAGPTDPRMFKPTRLRSEPIPGADGLLGLYDQDGYLVEFVNDPNYESPVNKQKRLLDQARTVYDGLLARTQAGTLEWGQARDLYDTEIKKIEAELGVKEANVRTLTERGRTWTDILKSSWPSPTINVPLIGEQKLPQVSYQGLFGSPMGQPPIQAPAWPAAPVPKPAPTLEDVLKDLRDRGVLT